MQVEVEHTKLVLAMRRLDDLATRIEDESGRASAATPIDLPSLAPLAAKVRWMRDQAPELEQLAALALLLDTEGSGSISFEMPSGQWDVDAMFDSVVAQRFGPEFAESTGLSDDEFRDLMLTFGSVGQDLPADSPIMSADDLRALIIAHPDLARALTSLRPRPGTGPEGTIAGLLTPVMTAPGGGAEVHEERRLAARDLFEGLGAGQGSILAMMFPSTVGGLNGVPFENLADANTVRIVVALEDERTNLSGLRDQHEENQGDWDFLGRNNNDLDGPIETSGDLISLYESILRDDRQILSFDPSGDGAMAELHGPITGDTDNVGILVPGTNSTLSSFEGTARRSRSFVAAAPSGTLSMISWLGGDLPDDLGAVDPAYSIDLAPVLTDFSRDVGLENARASQDDIEVTFAGHSYGGAVVGRSELNGLDADRVLHIESAGMGRDIDQAEDLPQTQDDVDRYSMTAPGDFIELVQGRGVGGWGHGADPDTFTGTVRLHTGDTVDGQPNTGWDAHSGVFETGSTAWGAMLAVFTGGEAGEAETFRDPRYRTIPTGRGGGVRVQDGWSDDGERVEIQ